jgi:hypothetical protein
MPPVHYKPAGNDLAQLPGRILPSLTRQLGRDNPDRAKAA